jgi:hypothetical protein
MKHLLGHLIGRISTTMLPGLIIITFDNANDDDDDNYGKHNNDNDNDNN